MIRSIEVKVCETRSLLIIDLSWRPDSKPIRKWRADMSASSTLVSFCRFLYSVVANLFRHMIWDCSQRKVLKRPLINVDQSQTQNRISQKWTWDDQQDPNVVLQHPIKNHQLSERFFQGITRSQNIPEKKLEKDDKQDPNIGLQHPIKAPLGRNSSGLEMASLMIVRSNTHTHMYYVENHDGDYNIDIFGIFSPGWGFLVAMAKMLKSHLVIW